VIERVDDRQRRIIREALEAAVHGPFLPDHGFATLIGCNRNELAVVLNRWPDSDSPSDQELAVNNVLNMLVACPHRQWSRFGEYSMATLKT
jgi:hypothetical protein